MSTLRKQLWTGVAALGFAAAGISNFAHSADDTAAPGAEQRAQFAERMHQREVKLHDELKLTAAQEGAWKTFIVQMKPPMPPLQRPDRAQTAALTAPERMDQRIAFMKQMEARLAVQSAALKKFYAVLTPDQQKILDRHFSQAQHGRFWHRGGLRDGAPAGMNVPANRN